MKNLHLLPTDKPSRLFYNKKDSIFTIDNDFEYVIKEDWFQDYNIYITNHEEIKEGDYVCASGGFRFVKTLNNDKGRTFKDDGIVSKQNPSSSCHLSNYKKIILTTDQDLIKDGVQAIDDEFLEWFVKNPSCEEVGVKLKQHFQADKLKRENPLNGVYHSYKIIIPKEEPTMIADWLDKHGDPEIYKKVEREAILKYGEPKQETLEEAAERMSKEHYVDQSDYWAVGVDSFKRGAKWQQEQYGLMEIELSHTKRLLASCEKALEDRDKQQERSYSEEEVLELIKKAVYKKQNAWKVGELDDWFEQFKNK